MLGSSKCPCTKLGNAAVHIFGRFRPSKSMRYMTNVIPDLQLNICWRILVQDGTIWVPTIQYLIGWWKGCGICCLVSKIHLLIADKFSATNLNEKWRQTTKRRIKDWRHQWINKLKIRSIDLNLLFDVNFLAIKLHAGHNMMIHDVRRNPVRFNRFMRMVGLL